MMKKIIFRNRNLRITVSLLCLIFCIGILSGCGRKADNNQTTSAAKTETDKQQETAEQKETAGQDETPKQNQTPDRNETNQMTEAVTEAGTKAPGETKEQSGQAKESTGAAEGGQTAKPQETVGAGAESGEEVFGISGDFPMSFTFSSGAGGWRTWLTLYSDGTFEGQYSDSEMGDTGEGYPNGSYYIADFVGKFGNVEKVDEFSYSMELEEITLDREPGTEWIEDEIRYVAAEAYGLDGGKAFILYTPKTPVAGLSEMFLGWWPGRFEEPAQETLSCYGIYNQSEETGFFTY